MKKWFGTKAWDANLICSWWPLWLSTAIFQPHFRTSTYTFAIGSLQSAPSVISSHKLCTRPPIAGKQNAKKRQASTYSNVVILSTAPPSKQGSRPWSLAISWPWEASVQLPCRNIREQAQKFASDCCKVYAPSKDRHVLTPQAEREDGAADRAQSATKCTLEKFFEWDALKHIQR